MEKTGHPRTLLLTLIGFFLLGLWNALRTIVLAEQSSFLLELGSHLDPRLRLGAALFWAFLFVALAVALLRRRPAARLWLPLALLSYALFRLAMVALFATASAARRGWQLTLLLFILAFVWTVWSLWRPANRHYWFPGEVSNDNLAR